MAIREYECKLDGRFETIVLRQEVPLVAICPLCGEPCLLVEWSVPAKRDPEKGIQT